MAMAKAKSDTSQKIQAVNNDGAPDSNGAAEAPRAFHVIDGRIFQTEGKGGTNA